MREPLASRPTLRWAVAFFFLILVAHDLHELAHTGVGRLICGAWGPRDFNVWSLADGCDTWVPTLMGPLLSWSLMWTGLLLTRSTDPARRWTGLALIFAPNPLGRLLPALVGGGDEGVVARTLTGTTGALPRALVVLAALVIILPPLVAAWRTLPVRWRAGWFLLLFAAGILVTGPLYIVLGNGLLARGVLTAPGILGAPRLIELASVAALVGLVFTGRGLLAVPAAGPAPGAGRSEDR
ncbi:MAG TPA: hypothetical protein VG712_07735 [Gemmatimonadales bacterium]|nr:hypothetical protein [Gemmatimonadales bacterium]